MGPQLTSKLVIIKKGREGKCPRPFWENLFVGMQIPNNLSIKLFILGSAKGVNTKRRTLLYDLNKQFKDLSQNVYPLIPNLSSENAKIPRIRVGKEAERKSKDEIKFQEKIRMEREEFKKSLKRKPEDLTEETSELNKKQKTEENGDETVDDTVDDNDDLTEKIHTEDEMPTENGIVTTGTYNFFFLSCFKVQVF